MPEVAPQLHEISTNEVRNVAVDMKGKLDASEVCTGTPTITEQTTSDLVLGSKAVSTEELTINGRTVPIGEAIQFTVDASGASATNSPYSILIVCGTDDSQTIDGIVKLSLV